MAGILSIDGMNVDELAAAQRGLDAHREGKLLVVADREAAEGCEDRALLKACNEAIDFAALVHAEVAEDQEPTTFLLHEGDEFSVYVDLDLPSGQWRHGERSMHQDSFTVPALRSLLKSQRAEDLPLVVTISQDLMPNAMAALIAIGEVGKRDVREWLDEVEAQRKPFTNYKPNASERIVFAVRECIDTVNAELKDANAESFPRPYRYQSGMLRPSAALSNAYDRLTEALMWAYRHEEKVARGDG